MKWIAALCLMWPALVLPGTAFAQDAFGHRTVRSVSWVEEWDPTTRSWVRVEEGAQTVVAQPSAMPKISKTVIQPEANTLVTTRTYEAWRYADPVARPARVEAVAQYGPFQVVDAHRVVMNGSTGSQTPEQFDAMMRDFPQLTMLDMVEAPGTTNDIANLALGRRIRAAGLTTRVPANGSVRSGAVELFLAGKTRQIAPGAQFAVHAWLDNYGREPDDFAPDSPANRLYLDYYQEMGMSERRARDFYAMTNSVPHKAARWLSSDEMRGWIAPEQLIVAQTVTAPALQRPSPVIELPVFEVVPAIAYSDLGAVSLASLTQRPAHAFLDS
ncbi:MAG: alpha/beta hydrolase [Pseudomonadota bacterium]